MIAFTKVLQKFPKRFFSFNELSNHSIPLRTLHNAENGINLSIYQNKEIQVSPLWLRHHCQCERCVHPSTHQRMIIPGQIRGSSKVKSVVLDSKSAGAESFEIIWNDNHVSNYSIKWLQDNLGDSSSITDELQVSKDDTVRSTTNISEVSVNYQDLLGSDNSLKEFMGHIRTFGFAMITSAPPDAASTLKAIERIAQPQVTLFGGFYEFESDLTHADTAYTSDYVHLHTDCTYLTEPNGLQVFHCLLHGGEGGINSVVDGFKIAQEFARERPEQFETLRSTPVPWQYIDPGKYCFYNVAPILQHDPYNGKLVCLRYNPHDMAPLNTVPLDKASEFYEAIINFSDKLEQSSVWFKLNPGMILFTDNWRVLHGRSEFTGSRKMCGSYISRSDWLSKCRVLFGP